MRKGLELLLSFAFFCPMDNHMRMKKALIIPIYQPTELVLPFLSKFKKGDFDYFVVVDDGSGAEFEERFGSIKELGLFTLLRLKKNKGKGKAMKTALSYLMKKDPDLGGVVTADGDGQHSYEDILKVRDALASHPEQLVLGTRNRKDMPRASQSGSWWSSFYFKMMSGLALEDTQTGLRGVPKRYFSTFLASPGSRYEFEMGFLASVAREERILTVPIETIYLNDNASTHFRKVIDSIRIARFPTAYIFSGVLLCFLDCLLYWLFAEYSFSKTGFGWLLTGFSASAVSFFVYELLTHCCVFFIRPRLAKLTLDFFVFAFLSLACFGLLYGFSCCGLDFLGSRILADAILFLSLFVLGLFLPSTWRNCYFLSR